MPRHIGSVTGASVVMHPDCVHELGIVPEPCGLQLGFHELKAPIRRVVINADMEPRVIMSIGGQSLIPTLYRRVPTK